jgi:Domain of unknown function (DUF4336)
VPSVTNHQPAARQTDWKWPWWPSLPLYPYSHRQTLRTAIISEWAWGFEQIQGILYVVTPLRMTVIRLNEGGLLVYAPIAPTAECLRLVNELVSLYGAVQHIILPTLSGLEHKVFVGPFARHYPTATVHVAPGQWSFPINLPLSWLGLPAGRTKLLGTENPFGERFDYAILGPIDLNLGKFGEVALFDRKLQLLLVTDTVLSIPAQPPAIIQLAPYPLLFHARDQGSEAIEDTPAHRLKGWQRVVLFTFYFRPSAVQISSLRQVLASFSTAPDKSWPALFGLYPFQWRSNWLDSFQAIQGHGRLLVAPILQQLILNRAPQQTLAWVERVTQWDFQQIIPCHFQAPILATPTEFRAAFDFLTQGQQLPSADFQLLCKIDTVLKNSGILPPETVRLKIDPYVGAASPSGDRGV